MIWTLTAFLTASIALSNFANGPAKWLMTAEEQQAWRNVKTDDEARDLIDLFFARRDPTPGTPVNEFRNEFESRVAFADREFKEGDVRGSLTERGRVLIVLGFPKNLGAELAHSTRQLNTVEGFDPLDPTGGRQLAAKDTWTYTHEAASRFGVPKIEVVFIHDYAGDRVRRDPQRTDFTMALPDAIKSYIVSPDMTTVPEWASSRLRGDRTIVAAQEHIETTTITERVKKGQVIIDAPRPIARPAGAGKLTLLLDTASLKPQSGSDPFVFESLTRFKKDQELGWAAEYCSGVISEFAPVVKVQLKLVGKDGTISSDPEEYVPDSIKASPGCYLLRGSVPLTDVESGSYTLKVAITAAVGQESYNLTRELRVE
ncbi:MAG TPA: GWxTD domain-containing protein [Thermoanaerobaculia bacterium]|jgi:GWxTD domain-containing protein|nr:GWxTD domain-containing protein [Thermoanaerobaculia bacterium]